MFSSSLLLELWQDYLINVILSTTVREKIGPIATPDYIQNAPGLPKTRSGKIMRRLLRKIAKNDHDLGDTSTVADPAVINHLFSNRCETVL